MTGFCQAGGGTVLPRSQNHQLSGKLQHMDGTGLQLDKATGRVLAPKGAKDVHVLA
jgi:hypothetical protein